MSASERGIYALHCFYTFYRVITSIMTLASKCNVFVFNKINHKNIEAVATLAGFRSEVDGNSSV